MVCTGYVGKWRVGECKVNHVVSFAGAYIGLTILLLLWGVDQVPAILTGLVFITIMGLGVILKEIREIKERMD